MRPFKENAECDSSLAPALRAACGRLPGQLPLACAPNSAFRTPHFFLLFLLLSVNAPAASESLLYPDGRQVLDVRSNERNPFVQQLVEPSSTTTSPQEGASEEARLRRILKAVKISGGASKSGHRQLLLGSLILKPGVILPPLLSNQSEALRVISVDDSSLTLEFVEKDPSSDARKILIPFDLKPEVTQFLYGEAVEELAQIGPRGQTKMPPLTAGGVTEILKGSQDAELQNIADRDVKLMGVVHDEQAPKKDQ